MFPLPTPLLLYLAYSIGSVGNTLLIAHVTDCREHGLLLEKSFHQVTLDFSVLSSLCEAA